MSEAFLVTVAATVELGVPVIGALLWWLLPPSRRFVSVCLGAVAPLLFAYLYVAASHLAGDDKFAWAFGAMWLMSFWPYAACLALGAALSTVSVPRGVVSRFGIGLLVPASIWSLVQVGV